MAKEKVKQTKKKSAGTHTVDCLVIMRAYWNYFLYVLQHKWYVACECFKAGLYIHAITHDLSKLRPSEFFAYAEKFYGGDYATVKTLFLIGNHMRIWDYMTGNMHKLSKCVFIANHPWLPELIQLARWDKKGRKTNWVPQYDKQNIIKKLNTVVEGRFKGNINLY